MTIKAVFFDLYHTLVTYDPPQQVLEARALAELGVDVDPQVFLRPLVMADEFIYEEIARRPLSYRTPEERLALYRGYQEILLREVGIDYDERLVMELLARMQKTVMNLALFPDVAPALTDLKGRGLTLGLISNVEQDIGDLLKKLGLPAWLDIIVTSQEIGYNKPNAEIFLAALRQAEVEPAEAIYTGDQYRVDVVGAEGAGMKGILLDRSDFYKELDCPRIASLTQLVDYL